MMSNWYECVILFGGYRQRIDHAITREANFQPPYRTGRLHRYPRCLRHYASGSEVVRAGLRALQERDAAVEKWLREEVVGVCDAMQSDPGRAIPGEQVFATIRARHADRLKKRRESQD